MAGPLHLELHGLQSLVTTSLGFGKSASYVDGPVDIAFSNSLFSHLTLNSILRCLISVRPVLSDGGVFYSTYFNVPALPEWPKPAPRDQWGTLFDTLPASDPFTTPLTRWYR